jgi:hypothetical protein
VEKDGDTKSATVTFEKPTAAKTALLLNNTQLGSNQISVTGSDHDETPETSGDTIKEGTEISPEDKPRARVLAEYIAHGYVIGDAAISKALDLDSKHKVSARFVNTLNALDAKFHATDRAKTADQSYGISARAGGAWNSLNSYFEKATNTPTGRRVLDFYTSAERNVLDVHKEARRLADLKTEEHGTAAKAAGLEKVLGVEKPQGTAAGSEYPNGPLVDPKRLLTLP